MTEDLNRQMGEVTTTMIYMKEQLEKLNSKIDKQQEDLDAIKIQVAEIRGGKKTIDWLRSIASGLLGAFISIATLYFTWRK